MAAKRRRGALKVGDRVRDKLTGRPGRIGGVIEAGGAPEYAVSYDEAPQDRYLTTPARDGAQRPRETLEPER